MADDLANFNKQIGNLPFKVKRQLAGAIAEEAARLATEIKAAAPVDTSQAELRTASQLQSYELKAVPD
jgi:hypothetical protein